MNGDVENILHNLGYIGNTEINRKEYKDVTNYSYDDLTKLYCNLKK